MIQLFLLAVSVVIIILLSSRWKIHPFLALFIGSLIYGIGSGMPVSDIVNSINNGFGNTLGKIGLIIVFGVIIGTFLEKTGGAFRLALKVLNLFGHKKIYETMGLVGFVVSIPVFCDSGFVLLSKLNNSITKKAGLAITGTATVLMLGLLISHVLIPPTPGPIAAAGIMDADIGLIMLLGLVIGVLALVIAVIYCRLWASKISYSYIPTENQNVDVSINESPSFIRSLLPILIPIILIITKSIFDFFGGNAESIYGSAIIFLGSPVIALFIGALLAFTLPNKWNSTLLSKDGWVGKAFRDAASILLITGAGGIFGSILQTSGIAEVITDILPIAGTGIFFPFILAAGLKTAQGSSTVAIITTASIVAPLMGEIGFNSEAEKALAVLAIGGGSLVVSHANDSAFWVMTQMSGIDMKAGYRSYTLGTLVVGTSIGLMAFLATLLI